MNVASVGGTSGVHQEEKTLSRDQAIFVPCKQEVMISCEAFRRRGRFVDAELCLQVPS